MQYIKDNQKRLHVDLYKDIMEALAHDCPASETGKFFVLSSSFAGSPWYMSAFYQDTMTIVHNFGNLGLCISFTCNLKWPEIQKELMAGKVAVDRSDLTVCVFHPKLEASWMTLLRKAAIARRVSWARSLPIPW